MRVEKPSPLTLVFKKFRQIMGQALLEHFLEGLTITVITPMRQARNVAEPGPRGPTLSAPKQWKSNVHVKSKTV